jgi:tetratricopeptide (TPR) repeat protein
MAKRLEKIYREPKPNHRAVVLDVGFEGSTQTHQRQRDSSEEDFFSGREQDRRFVEAFRGFGIDVEALGSGEAAKLIRDTSICQALVQSLDDWAAMRKRARGDQDGLWKKLVEIARQADHDEWRNRCREALLRRDRAALEKLAHTLPIRKVPPATVYVLGHVLKDLGALDKAMTVLREARQHHPEDFWLNEALGFFSKDAVHPPRYDDALRYYTAALVLRPWNMHTHMAVAMVLDKKGEIDEAIAEYSKAIELEPNASQVWMERANAYYRLQRYDKAVADWSKVIELEPNNATAWNNQGSSHNRLGQYVKGIANLSKAIELNPNNAIPWHNRGCSYLGLREFDKAIAEYSKAIDLNPHHVRAWRHRGIVYFELQQYDKAVADLSKSIKLDQQQGIAWHYRASSYIRLRQHDKAVADLNKVIELEPKNAMAWVNRGFAFNELRQYDKAIADWNKAKELDPKNAPAGYRLGNALLSLGQWGKAADAFAKMTVEWEPKDRFLWYTITAVWLYKGDLLRYRRACREMLARFGKTDDPAVAEQTAKTCLLVPDAVRDLDLVMKLADLAIQKNGSSRWIQFTKALAEYRAGHYPKALEWLQRVSAKADGDCLDAIALALLAMTRKQLGQVKQAHAALKQAQALLADKQPQLDKGRGLYDWHNWLRSLILSREAESLLATKGKDTHAKDTKKPEIKK